MSTLIPARSELRHEAASARAQMLGRTRPARVIGVLATVAVLALVAWMHAISPGPTTDAWLLAIGCAIAAIHAARATRVAERTQQVMAGLVVPLRCAAAWRRGWWQSQLMIVVVVVVVVVVMSALATETTAESRDVGHAFRIVPGAILASQAAGTWGVWRGRGRWLAWAVGAAWLWPVAVLLYVRSAWTSGLATNPPVALSIVLFIAGLAALEFARRRLAETERTLRARTPPRSGNAFTRFLRSWDMVNRSRRGRSWDAWLAIVYLYTSSFWMEQGRARLFVSDYLPLRLAVLLGLVALCCTTLSVRGLHWRLWLQPGAPMRRQLGRTIFVSTASMHAGLGLVVVTGSWLSAWFTGHSTDHVFTQFANAAVIVPELLFAIAAATALTGRFKGRVDRRGAVVAAAVLAGAIIVALVVMEPWRADSLCRAWPRTGLGYAITLVVIAAGLVAWADRLWSRRDLQTLMGQGGSA